MGNRTRTHSVDPKRINNYNKFLCTLDKTTNTTKTPKEPPTPDSSIKDEIDDIISTAQTSFNANHDSPSFTGQLTTDSSSIDSNDPNYYNNNLNPGYLFFYAPF